MVMIIILGNFSWVLAQAPDSLAFKDSLIVTNPQLLSTLLSDTIRPDSLLALDTLAPIRKVYAISPDGLDAEVQYSMRDSMHYSIREKKIYLYGDAKVVYTDLTLGAGYMVIDYGNNLVIAEPAKDSAGNPIELPNFKQGAQEFEAKGMRYNIETRKGIVYDATTTQGDLFVLGGKTKIVAADERDPMRTDNTIFNSDAIITTCNLPHPHYGIRSNKQKVVQNKQVIVGPSNVELGGVPTPLWLPFGFFPVGSTERSGLIFPTDYQYTEVDGFGFQKIGWYFPWNDVVHSEVTADIYLKGTLRLNTNSTYKKKYKYQGGIFLGGSRNRFEAADATETFNNSYFLRWTHSQDQKANPYRNFRSSVNIQTNDYARVNGQNLASQITNEFRSSLAATFKFPDHPSWNLTVGADHSQNTSTRRARITFPQARFSTGQFYPFANLGTSSSAWYKKATITYNAQFSGIVDATDTTLFMREPWQDALLGGQHSAAFSAPVTFAKYFRISPNVNFQQTLYFDQLTKEYQRVPTINTTYIIIGPDTLDTVFDTTFTGNVVDVFDRGLNAATSFNANVSLSTNIFGTARFKIGKLRGIRHIMTPNLSLGYTPDYSDDPFNYYREVQRNEAGDVQRYLRFPTQPFSPGSLPDELALRVGYTLGNRIETKIQGREDSSSTIVALINNLNFSGSYNLEAQTLKWSPITVSGAQLSLFKKIVRINANGGRFDVYERNSNGERVDTLLASKGLFPIRFEAIRFNLSAGLTLSQLRDLIAGRAIKATSNDVYSLVSKFRISYNYSIDYERFRSPGRPNWESSANTINASGSIPLSSKWSIRSLTLGYDIRNQRITFPTLGLGRDLHCWEMDFFWVPRLNTFTFGIRVKPSSLGFLDIPYKRGSRF